MDWTVGLATFGAGLVVGALLFSLIRPGGRRNLNAERELRKVQQEYRAYREKVDEHFSHNTELVNNLTAAYEAVYEHMAKGAATLCPDDSHARQLTSTTLESDFTKLMHTRSAADAAAEPPDNPPAVSEPSPAMEQPKDYAPRSGPWEKGTLQEDFGLKEDSGERA